MNSAVKLCWQSSVLSNGMAHSKEDGFHLNGWRTDRRNWGDIKNIIKSLTTKIYHGYDEISVKLITICSPYICSPLTYICNSSLPLGLLPDRLKYREIIPLSKKDDKANKSNYRPISLLTTFSKAFEKKQCSFNF